MKNIQSNISKELVSLLTSPAFECGINGKIITTYYPWNLHGITDDPDPLLDIHTIVKYEDLKEKTIPNEEHQ